MEGVFLGGRLKKYNFNSFLKVETAGLQPYKGDVYSTHIILKRLSCTFISSQKQIFPLKTCHVSLIGLNITGSLKLCITVFWAVQVGIYFQLLLKKLLNLFLLVRN